MNGQGPSVPLVRRFSPTFRPSEDGDTEGEAVQPGVVARIAPPLISTRSVPFRML